MPKYLKELILIILTSCSISSYAQNSDYITFSYYQDDSISLDMDVFFPDSMVQNTPVIIFVHGGGFSGGTRSSGYEFCRFASENGMIAATLTYTLSMKGRNFSCGGIQSEKIKTIQLAAYQTRVATQWFINRATEYSIDTNSIFLSGSSAGAEAVLQAAYWNKQSDNYFPDTLSNCFKYAGVISGAGALLDINMINGKSLVPTMCYHGTCDPLVPYYIAPHHYCSQISTGYLMMFGGLAIHERIQELNGSSHLMSYCNEGHKHASTAFYGDEMNTVLEFIHRTLNGEKLNIHRVFKNNEECEMGLDFVFCY